MTNESESNKRSELNRSLGTMSRTAALEKIRDELGLGPEEAEAYYNAWRRRTRRGFALMGLLFVLVGLLLLGRNVARRVRAADINSGSDGIGRVVRVVQDREGRAAPEYFHTFTYDYEGQSYRVRSRVGIRTQYGMDSDVPIRISDRNPGRAEILNTLTGEVYLQTGQQLWALVLIAAGGFTFWVGVLRKPSDPAGADSSG